MRAALQRAAILSNEKYRGVASKSRRPADRIIAQPRAGRGAGRVEAETQASDLAIGFNVNYLLDALGALRDEHVVIQLRDANSSALVREARFAFAPRGHAAAPLTAGVSACSTWNTHDARRIRASSHEVAVMWVERLQLGEFRRFQNAGIEPAPGLNLITGAMAPARPVCWKPCMSWLTDEASATRAGWIDTRRQGGHRGLRAMAGIRQPFPIRGCDAAGVASRKAASGIRQAWTGSWMACRHHGRVVRGLARASNRAACTGQRWWRAARRFLDWGCSTWNMTSSLSRRYARAEAAQRAAEIRGGCIHAGAWDRELAAPANR
jgi:hypothetical protein